MKKKRTGKMARQGWAEGKMLSQKKRRVKTASCSSSGEREKRGPKKKGEKTGTGFE